MRTMATRQLLYVPASYTASAPAPGPQKSGKALTLTLPLSELSFLPLFRCLDVDTIITLFTAVLLEYKIVLFSSSLSLPTTMHF